MPSANSRKQEILEAATKLYETETYCDITIRKISSIISMSRSSIYNYFKTKEEIFLSLLEEQYLCWTEELERLLQEDLLDQYDFLAKSIAKSLEERPLMLKLIANNIAVANLEEGSRMERITSFKKAYGATLVAMDHLLKATNPTWSKKERQEIIYSFFPYLYGLYPYAQASDRQRQGLEEAGVDFHFYTVYDLTYHLLKKLLK